VRRTYKQVNVIATADGFGIALDGKPLSTPAGTPIIVPTECLAQAVAAEWAGQPDVLDLNRAPLSQIAGIALDRIAARRSDIRDELLAYAQTELVCHRAEGPPALVSRQQATWQPLLDWLAREFAAPLTVNQGVMANPQPPASLAALARAMALFDDFALAALSLAVAATGSLVIGLALATGEIDITGAFDAAELDATYQIERWGEDGEATKRRAQIRNDLAAAARFMALLATPSAALN